MTPNDERSTRIANFLRDLEAIPWFDNIGAPIPATSNLKRISRWEEWPGPDTDGCNELSMRQQALYDEIMANAKDKREPLSILWNQIHECIFRVSAPKVPYDPEKDCYHAPSMAVWQAAWTAGLVGLCLYLQRQTPDELNEQWKWFVQGHWPCGYAYVDASDQLGPLMVY